MDKCVCYISCWFQQGYRATLHSYYFIVITFWTRKKFVNFHLYAFSLDNFPKLKIAWQSLVYCGKRWAIFRCIWAVPFSVKAITRNCVRKYRKYSDLLIICNVTLKCTRVGNLILFFIEKCYIKFLRKNLTFLHFK